MSGKNSWLEDLEERLLTDEEASLEYLKAVAEIGDIEYLQKIIVKAAMINQSRFAKMVDLSRAQVSRWKTKGERPSLATVNKVVDLLKGRYLFVPEGYEVVLQKKAQANN